MIVEINIDGHVFRIRPDPTKRNWFYCVMQNPFKDFHSTEIIFGGSYEIVERKIQRQYKRFKGEIK